MHTDPAMLSNRTHLAFKQLLPHAIEATILIRVGKKEETPVFEQSGHIASKWPYGKWPQSGLNSGHMTSGLKVAIKHKGNFATTIS